MARIANTATPIQEALADGAAKISPQRSVKIFGLPGERVQELEEQSRLARVGATTALSTVYQSRLVIDPEERLWLSVDELAFAVLLLVGGSVRAVANLKGDDGERLAGGIRWQGKSEAEILYEAYDPSVRQRFTLGHELGHFVLHGELLHPHGGAHGDPPRGEADEDIDTLSTGETGAECQVRQIPEEEWVEDPIWEREADAFAAAFLIPGRRLADDIARFGRSVPFLSTRYGVSATAMHRRIQTLEALGLFAPVFASQQAIAKEDVG